MFTEPPLVELIAELRWALPQNTEQNALAGNVLAPMVVGNANTFEEFFMRFGGEAQKQGFTTIERLTPTGFPLIGSQPVFRFRKPAADSSVLYQVGAGLFSANAVPPYKSWEQFAPVVEQGINSLLLTRDNESKEMAFTTASLRYIDAFGPNLTEGLRTAEFIEKIFQIKLSLPNSISKLHDSKKPIVPFIQLQIPLSDSLTMSLGIGEGLVQNKKSLIMDTTVASTVPIEPNGVAVMRMMNVAHDYIHSMFVEMTKPIQGLMKPVRPV